MVKSAQNAGYYRSGVNLRQVCVAVGTLNGLVGTHYRWVMTRGGQRHIIITCCRSRTRTFSPRVSSTCLILLSGPLFASTYEVNVFMLDQNEQTSFYLRNKLIEKNYVRKATFLLTLLGRY